MRIESKAGLPSEQFGRNPNFLASQGAADQLIIVDVGNTKNPWKQISDFINSHQGKYIFGYLGFDLHRETNPNLKAAGYPSAHLFVPEEISQISKPNENHQNGQFLNSSSFSTPTDEEHQKRIQKVLDWVGTDQERQVTVARKVDLPQGLNFDSVRNIAPGALHTERFFHLKTDFVEILGNSPELLAEGNLKEFRTYKLSGTAPTPQGLMSEKIQTEHAGSVKRVRQRLSTIGLVRHGTPEILQLPYLSHLLTVFETKPNPNASIADCLHAVLPTGVSPLEEGLELLSEVESDGRGAYYGLIGVIHPDGHFEFSQVLRTIFRDKQGSFAWAGGSITRDSNPQEEVAETIIKLKGCPQIELGH